MALQKYPDFSQVSLISRYITFELNRLSSGELFMEFNVIIYTE